jgi:hypothetical protein
VVSLSSKEDLIKIGIKIGHALLIIDKIKEINENKSDGKKQKIPIVTKKKQQNEQSIVLIKTKSGKGLWVGGNTLPHKEDLKKMGGKWNPQRGMWIFNMENDQKKLLKHFQYDENKIYQEK